MNIKIFLLSLILLSMMNKFDLLKAQGESIEQITIFGSRIKNPVVTDVRTEQNNIYFNVNNKSFYPYIFEVTFGDFRNLSPRVFDKKVTLSPGINRLFTFKILNPKEAPVLSYQTRYYPAKTNSSDQKFNSYLVPIGRNRTVEFQTINDGKSIKIFIDQFVMNIGDTVFNSRKGIVTALPDNSGEIDRIIYNSFEIRHEDGTIAVYLGLNSDVKVHKLGQVVFPGQPIGIIGASKLLTFRVYEMQDEGMLKAINILYSGQDTHMILDQNLNGTKVFYSADIIKKEMTRKEISRFDKHTLY